MQSKENTRNRIAQACLELLNTTSLETLRAQDIMEKAGVSRSTFYRHFLDKYEVAAWVYQQQAESIIQDRPDLKSWKDWTRLLRSYMREHKAFFRNVASYQGQNSFRDFLRTYFMGNVLKHCKRKGIAITEDQRYAIYASSLIAAQSTVDWILDDFSLDDETAIRRNELCIPPCIQFLYD